MFTFRHLKLTDGNSTIEADEFVASPQKLHGSTVAGPGGLKR